MFKNLIKAIAFAGLAGVMAFGQTTLSTTTLSSAVNASTKAVIVASASGITAPGVPNGTTLGGPVSPYSYMVLVVDQEVMRVTGVNGTTIYVQRGNEATQAVAHNSGALVYVTRPSNLTAYDMFGACTINGSLVIPKINPKSGHVFNCMTTANGAQWGSYQGGFTPVVGAAITGASTIAPTANVTHITGTTALSTITVPAGLVSGESITLIFDSAETWNNSGNIAAASAAAQAAGESLTLTYDSATSKFYPSHL